GGHSAHIRHTRNTKGQTLLLGSRLQATGLAADGLQVRLAIRHFVGVLLVCSGLCVAVGAFTFARPAFQPRYQSTMIDFSQSRYFSPQHVRDAFAAHGIPLHPVDRMSGFVTYFRPGSSGDAKALAVNVAPRNGKGSWGPKLEAYDARFGNILVTYGGNDRGLLR